ncbi:MAG: DUF488 domain-containing protein [Proteobacteria bacterium]|nr:DUF488 domain-containing protein [Pseudomonadota bacterium]
MLSAPFSFDACPADAVFTIGHSTLDIAAFITRLQHYGIRQLADIRSVRRSRHNPQFAADALAASLAAAGIHYLAAPALGGFRRTHAGSINDGWHNASFRGYADYMQTDAFATAIDALIASSRQMRTAIMCAEAVPWRCHRSLVADALNVRGIAVFDIVSEHSCRAHSLTAFARVDGTTLTYPAPTPAA